MKYIKAIGAGLAIYLVGQALAIVVALLDLVAVLAGATTPGLLTSVLQFLSFGAALVATGYLAGLPDKSRSIVFAGTLLTLGFFVPAMIGNALRLHEVAQLAAPITPGQDVTPDSGIVALVQLDPYGIMPAGRNCNNPCRPLLASGAARLVVVARGSLGASIDRPEVDSAWRFDDSPRCRKAVKDSGLLAQYRQQNDLLPPATPMIVETVRSQVRHDPLDACFLPADTRMDQAQLAFVSMVGGGPVGADGTPFFVSKQEILVRAASGWQVVGRSGEIAYGLERYPYRPKLIWPSELGATRPNSSTRQFGDPTLLANVTDHLIIAALNRPRS